MFPTIERDELTKINGGEGTMYNIGYGLGGGVTKLYEKTSKGAAMVPDPSNSSRMIPKADIPVVGPMLSHVPGLGNLARGATDVCNDRANLHAVPR